MSLMYLRHVKSKVQALVDLGTEQNGIWPKLEHT